MNIQILYSPARPGTGAAQPALLPATSSHSAVRRREVLSGPELRQIVAAMIG
jgi:hypothetical protein